MTTPGEEDFDSRAAAALIRHTTDTARRALDVQAPRLYASWGVAWLIGLGAMWLSVRGQARFHGPSAGSAILLGVLLLGALVVTVVTIVRATHGVHGQSELQGRIYGLAWPVGYAAWYTLQGALANQGADGRVLGLVGATGPLLVTSLIFLLGGAIWLDRPMATVGVWLAVVSAAGVWTGPVTVLLVNAVAGGGGFLAMAGYLAWRGRR